MEQVRNIHFFLFFFSYNTLTERKITRIVFVSPDTIHGVYNNNRKN